MLSKTYDALKAAGAPEDKAREAAEELAGFENRLASIDGRLASLEGKFTVTAVGDGDQCGGNDRHSWRVAKGPRRLIPQTRDLRETRATWARSKPG